MMRAENQKMSKAQQKAWACLRDPEKQSLYLILSNGLSTWEAGEVIGLHHYKYLELKARSEKFFKMFTDFFTMYPDLIRPGVINDNVRDYFDAAIMKRLDKDECVNYAGDNKFRLLATRRTSIITAICKLRRSENQWDKDACKLIIEFDRWNNFRILPKELQAPSAYNRRKAKKEKSYIKYLKNFPEPTLAKLIDLIYYNGKPFRTLYFVALSETLSDEGYIIVPFKKSTKNINHLTGLKFYIFEDILDAELFGQHIKNYFELITSSKEGHLFWKEYRKIIEKSFNYKTITNIDIFNDTLDNF